MPTPTAGVVLYFISEGPPSRFPARGALAAPLPIPRAKNLPGRTRCHGATIAKDLRLVQQAALYDHAYWCMIMAPRRAGTLPVDAVTERRTRLAPWLTRVCAKTATDHGAIWVLHRTASNIMTLKTSRLQRPAFLGKGAKILTKTAK